MAQKNVFKKNVDLKQSTERNAFDLSKRVLFTAKPGELLPIYHRTMMPGDKFHINLSTFSRTAPVVSSPFTSIKEYYDFFFVPYRLLWHQADQVMTKNTTNSQVALSPTSEQPISSSTPYMSGSRLYQNSSNIFQILNQYKDSYGFNRAYGASKLLNCLGYPYIDNTMLKGIIDGSKFGGSSYSQRLSAYPLMAYHKIYNDFFRNSRWEKSKPYLFNCDYASNGAVYFPESKSDNYWNQGTMFDLHYADYARDIVMSIMPARQLGDSAKFDVDVALKMKGSGYNEVLFGSNKTGSVQLSSARGYLSSNNSSFVGINSAGKTLDTSESSLVGQVLTSDIANKLTADTTSAAADILDVRNSMFVQRYREILGTGRLDYKNIVSKIFGFDGTEDMVDTVKYLGGNSSFIKFNTQVNSNFADDGENGAVLRATATGQVNEDIDFTSPCHGIIMCIYHALPQIDYISNGMHFDVNKVSVDDYANPVFDKLGLQPVNVNNFTMNQTGNVGFNLRYYDYKGDKNDVVGGFRESLEYKSFVAGLDISELIGNFNSPTTGLSVSYQFFKCDPRILDPIFSLKATENVNTDTFICEADFNVTAVRNLSKLGFPY